jgi:hypothetical protein
MGYTKTRSGAAILDMVRIGLYQEAFDDNVGRPELAGERHRGDLIPTDPRKPDGPLPAIPAQSIGTHP